MTSGLNSILFCLYTKLHDLWLLETVYLVILPTAKKTNDNKSTLTWLGLCYQLLNRRRKHKPNPYVECTNVRNIFIKCTHLTKALFKVTYKAFKLYICTALCFPENQIDYHCLHHVLPVAVIFIFFCGKSFCE